MKLELNKSRLLLFLMGISVAVHAQVELEVLLDQDKFLPAEQLMAGVRIVNRSGQALILGEDVDWAQFSIQRLDGGVVHKLNDPPLQGSFRLESGERATVKVDIAPHYDLRQQGRYHITGLVKLKEWSKIVASRPLPFEIVEGTKLWEQEFGVPQSAGSAAPPESR